MKISAIICEYNPFHTGHMYQIKKIKENIKDTSILCLMSGNFVQRGGVAVLDKHTRAKTALKNGADLVIELPCFFSTQVAQIFSQGAISILNSLNIVDYICFGSESGNIDNLIENAKKILSNEDSNLLKENLKLGKSYVKSYSDIQDIPSTSNDILAIEYIKSLINTKSAIKPYTIMREGSAYNDTSLSNIYSSATAIRNSLKDSKSNEYIKRFIPKNSIEYFNKKYFKFDEDFFKYIKYSILYNKDNIGEIFEVSEGIENLIYSNIKKANTLEEMILLTKSKRYTFARIRRILFNILLNISKKDINIIKGNNYTVPYIKILGFTDNGRKILKKIKGSSENILVNKFSTYRPQNEYEKMFYDKDILSTNLYNIEEKSYYHDDFITSPIYMK